MWSVLECSTAKRAWGEDHNTMQHYLFQLAWMWASDHLRAERPGKESCSTQTKNWSTIKDALRTTIWFISFSVFIVPWTNCSWVFLLKDAKINVMKYIYIYIYIYTHTNKYIYIYICRSWPITEEEERCLWRVLNAYFNTTTHIFFNLFSHFFRNPPVFFLWFPNTLTNKAAVAARRELIQADRTQWHTWHFRESLPFPGSPRLRGQALAAIKPSGSCGERTMKKLLSSRYWAEGQGAVKWRRLLMCSGLTRNQWKTVMHLLSSPAASVWVQIMMWNECNFHNVTTEQL